MCADFQLWQSGFLYLVRMSYCIHMSEVIQSSIRDPLFVISTSLEIIKHKSDDKSVQAEIQRIEKALEKICKIIN